MERHIVKGSGVMGFGSKEYVDRTMRMRDLYCRIVIVMEIVQVVKNLVGMNLSW